MTEREKMLAGQLYDCGDPELLAQWHRAKDLVRDYNQADSADFEKKSKFYANFWGEWEKTSGLPLPFMWITEITFSLATTAK